MRCSRPAVRLFLLSALFLSACAPISQPRELPPAADTPATGGPEAPYAAVEIESYAEDEKVPYLGRGYPSLAPVLRRVTPAVVNVSVEADVSGDDHPFLRDPEFLRFLEKFDLPLPDKSADGRRQSVGSGFIVDARRGYVLTNRHVIENARSITVTLKDRRNYRAVLVGSDSGADIAVLRISPVPSGLRALKFGNSGNLEVGDFVLAIGNPFGIGQTVTSGIVSALGRQSLGDDGIGDLIQTDASINPGNSGGPLVNLRGRVVGVNTALIGPSGGNVGIGFATPGNRALTAMNRMLRGG